MPGLCKKPFRSAETVDRLLTACTLPLDDDVLCYANLVGSATGTDGIACALCVCFFTHFGVYYTQVTAEKGFCGTVPSLARIAYRGMPQARSILPIITCASSKRSSPTRTYRWGLLSSVVSRMYVRSEIVVAV